MGHMDVIPEQLEGFIQHFVHMGELTCLE